MDYMFFAEKNTCVPMYELSRKYRHWENKLIEKAALMNAIYNHFPDYMIANNIYVQSGIEDSLLSDILGENYRPTQEKLMQRMIISDPTVGEQYFLWDKKIEF